mmetsp:Transcript_8131/g.22996  ORF Transcript_8131/g.22996 Transcript_8131/m.22996 type:complete len:135 (-) Transcript_8131:54-458(-)
MENDAICSVCEKQIYSSDLRRAIGKSFHRWCFRCTQCNTSLTLGRERAHEGKAYCVRCHQSLFGATGFRGAASSIDTHARRDDVNKKVVTAEGDVPKTIPPASTASASKAKFCSSCGAPVAGNFCGSCGMKVVA